VTPGGEMFAKLNTPIALIIALVLFVAIDGLVIYRYQQQSEGYNVSEPVDGNESFVAEEPTTPVAKQEEADTSENSTAPVAEQEEKAEESETSTAPVAEQEPPTAEEAAVSAEEAVVPSSEGSNAVRVVVNVVDAPSWLRVQEDRQIVLDQLGEPGFSQEFVADRAVTVQAGDAGAVRVEVDGQDVGPLGEGGEAVTRTYTAQ
jgi:hypothetical protein